MKYSMHKLSVLIVVTITLSSAKVMAQVRSNMYYFNNGAPNSTAFLDASSSPGWNNSSSFGKGLIFPRVDLTKLSSLAITGSVQADNFPSLMDGMIVYNTAVGNSLIGNIAVSPGFYYYKNSSNNLLGGVWSPLVSATNPGTNNWPLTGSSGVNKSRYFGTQNLNPLIFKVNGIEAARILVNGDQPGSLNLNAPLQLRGEPILSYGRDMSGNNLLVGNIVASSLTGKNNTLLGASSGKNLNLGSNNTLIGALAGSAITDGYENTFIGDNAGNATSKGSFNTAIGRYAGPSGDLKYTTVIGNGAVAKQNNTLIMGADLNRLAIGINTETPRATLDVATDDAIVLPVGDTKTQPVTTAVPGMLRFNKERDFAEYFNNYKAWVNLSKNTGWTLEGNYGTVPAYNYVGTADDQPMRFGANNQEAFRITPKGKVAPAFVNIKAPLWLKGQRMLWQEDAGKGPNMMFGAWDKIPNPYLITGANNILFGVSAGGNITSGNNNIFLGYSAGLAASTGNDNIGIGGFTGPDYPGISKSMTFYVKNRPRKSNSLIFGDEITGYLFNAVGVNTSSPVAIFHVNSTDAMIVPSGTTTQRPPTAEGGMLRFNETTKLLEYFDGLKWVSLSPPKILKMAYTAQNYTLPVWGYQTYDIPFPGAKLGGVVDAQVQQESYYSGQAADVIMTEHRVIADGIVRVVFMTIRMGTNTTPSPIYFVGPPGPGVPFKPTFTMNITVIQ
ncbi:hypothetical protein [Pedobacter boryungensis]|uniref:Uncharacterized protein n=1 Tax=Pedobacter boryungensis TaxID=869962 RepID=A0ABX2DGQ6_9SPHI|nr:hypothetical protein [Pedobacter boryungensis]NQX33160.1 hypothetical protein [Pedobacter boryungensis]